MICAQCGKKPAELSNAVAYKWAQEETALCPPCMAKWNKPAVVGGTSPRCGGCGRRTTALTGDRCKRCIEHGVELLDLFDREVTS